jgi:hypothetical protein
MIIVGGDDYSWWGLLRKYHTKLTRRDRKNSHNEEKYSLACLKKILAGIDEG